MQQRQLMHHPQQLLQKLIASFLSFMWSTLEHHLQQAAEANCILFLVQQPAGALFATLSCRS
jgi:hypothetical protein